MSLRLRWLIFKYHISKVRGNLYTWIAWRAPRKFVEACAIRVMAYATTGIWERDHPDTVSIMDALLRWQMVEGTIDHKTRYLRCGKNECDCECGDPCGDAEGTGGET